MPQEVRVAEAAKLALGEAKKFPLQRDGETVEGFVMRHASGLVAYLNRCPHWGVDLDMGEGRFYAAKVDRIFCVNHGALFEPTTGACDAGPCAGGALEKFAVREDGSDAVVTVPVHESED